MVGVQEGGPRPGSDAELAARLAARDAGALGELYDRFGSLAFSVALRVVGDTGRAEDVVQDAFLKLWNGAGGFDPKRGSLRTWLITSVRNRAIDQIRGRGAHERREQELRADFVSRAPNPEHQLTVATEREAVRAALADLPAEQRQVVALAYFLGYTQAEIAQATQVPLSTVKGRMRLALEKLASYLRARGIHD